MGAMTEWDEIGCQRGCAEHPTRLVDVHLGGPTPYRDLTPIPNRFACNFQFEVWDTDLMPVDDNPLWCPAHDAVSETILSLGVWEPQNTTVLMLAWEALGPTGRFIDMGAQLGWFSTLAAAMNVSPWAWEVDRDVAKVARRNIGRQTPQYAFAEVRIGHPGLAPFVPSGDDLFTAKIDVEGAEAAAVQLLMPAIDGRRVPFILMEMSPCFNDTYGDLAVDLLGRGYIMYEMPPKQTPPVQIDSLRDLIPYAVLGGSNEVRTEVESWHQRDVLFALDGVQAWI